MTLAARIDALLPQTQCTRCGEAACLPYAQALAEGRTTPNLCEPGGDALIPQLARLAGLPASAAPQPAAPPRVAWIREDDCIGCARCLPACPVDAILGARRLAHTVIAADCTGCELCLPPCPVDCIELRAPPADWQAPAPADNRRRYHAHVERLARRAEARQARRSVLAVAPTQAPPPLAPANAAGGGAPAAAPATRVPGMAERRAALIAQAQAAAAARRNRT